MPVMKNEFDIYKAGRGRNATECTNNSNACRSRKVSETRSECPSFSTSPSTVDCQRNYMNRTNSSAKAFSRTSSRTSQASLTSPTRNAGCSPPKPSSGSQGSLNKFHTRLVDKLRKSFSKARSVDRSWEQATDVDDNANKPNDSDSDDNMLLDGSVAKSYEAAKTHRQPVKKSSLSSDSASVTPADSQEIDIGHSDSELHISSKPPLPPGSHLVSYRYRSRSIETTMTQKYRHSSIIASNRMWSVDGYPEPSKANR